MTDNEIVKAWEKVLNNSDEPIGEHWMVFVTTQMAKETFDMLTRQKVEIVNRTEEYNDMLEQRNKVEEALEIMTMDVNSLTSERDALNEMVAEQKAEIGRLRSLVDTMSDYFPACINCEGKTPLGERTDKCVYLIDDTEYCAKRGIETIARIVKENKSQKAEIERLRCSATRNGKQIGSLIYHLEQAKSEAYKEFAKEFVDDLSHMLTYDKDYIKAKIFNLVETKQKELTEK